MIKITNQYQLNNDIKFILEAEKINLLDLSEKTGISRTTLNSIENGSSFKDTICEKFYSFIYENNYRINRIKEEIIKEKYHNVLFHGSKNGLTNITINGSRNNCDFGSGFYLGETYNQALSFICEKDHSSIYSFRYSTDDLKIKQFTCDLDWMLAICYYRGTIKEYEGNAMINKAIAEVEDSDLIIAPIADNKMFYIMAQFTDGEINADVALHSLSASNLGFQYIFKTEKALEKLIPIEKYYISTPERNEYKNKLIERGYEIDTKLKLAKREFKNGLYIEEILK